MAGCSTVRTFAVSVTAIISTMTHPYGLAYWLTSHRTDAPLDDVTGLLTAAAKVGHHLPHRRRHVVDILVGHAVEHRETDQRLVRRFGLRTLSTAVAEAVAVIRMEMDRHVVNVDA